MVREKQVSPDGGDAVGSNRGRWAAAALLLAAVLMAVFLMAGPVASQPERPTPAAFGGGEYVPAQADRIDADERAGIEAMLASNEARLAAEGRLPHPRTASHMGLGWPLAGRDGFTDPGYHAVTGFVDHAAGYPNQLLDYACGGRTYDSYSGYNHQGTDFYLWPFAWNKMAAGDVEVVAAAGGIIIGRTDGNSDQSCTFNSNRWNAVYVRHADGSVAWYGHLKRGSVTPKAVGAPVAAGEYLGTVGSSGNSTGPHLHFELYVAGKLTDPYAGSCNALDGGAWWASQRNYYDSGLNRLATGTAPVSWGACPQPDTPHEATQFQPGDRITFTAYYRDQVDTRPSLYRIIDPNGAVYAQWSHTIPKPHYTLAYWWWAYDFPADATTGTWQFEVAFNGQSYRHSFNVGAPSTPVGSPTPPPVGTPVRGLDWRGYVPALLGQ
ncbi:MAG: peptidoglycan DD-metalloendopeptidase family protein [Candidatus Promineofilum sp.]|nr:peptidoglycan DD-metalloendopeptidase family protein [Promineifilum sp.]